MNTKSNLLGRYPHPLIAALVAMLVLSACKDPEPVDPATLIPDWKTYYNRQVGIEFGYPYTLNLNVDTTAAGQLVAELQWIGRGTTVFRLETRDAAADEFAATSNGPGQVGGLRASITELEVDGEMIERWTVVRDGRAFDFSGGGMTFEKVLESVKFLDGNSPRPELE